MTRTGPDTRHPTPDAALRAHARSSAGRRAQAAGAGVARVGSDVGSRASLTTSIAAINIIRSTVPEIYPPVHGLGVVRVRPLGLGAVYPDPDEDLDDGTQVLISYGSAATLAHELASYAPELAAWIGHGRWLSPLAYLNSISVAESLQGRGLGDELLHQALAALYPLGISRVILHAAGDTAAQTKRLVRWYQRHGFVLVPATDQLGRHRHPGMIKRL